jgi:hypothetical protein
MGGARGGRMKYKIDSITYLTLEVRVERRKM